MKIRPIQIYPTYDMVPANASRPALSERRTITCPITIRDMKRPRTVPGTGPNPRAYLALINAYIWIKP